MKRALVALMVFPFFLSAISAADATKITIRWFGHSFFLVESSIGTRIVFDPHAIEDYGKVSLKADLVLVSHFHNDHTQIGVIENKAKAKILGGLQVMGKKTDWNLIDEKFQDVHIKTVGTYHDTIGGMDRGLNGVFIVEVDGLRIVHLGDLGHILDEKQVKQIGKVDILMIPVGGVYTINGAEAKKVVEQLKPRLFILPMHYGTKAFEDVLPPDEFMEDQKNVRKLPGNKLEVETDAKPDKPTVILMNWK